MIENYFGETYVAMYVLINIKPNYFYNFLTKTIPQAPKNSGKVKFQMKQMQVELVDEENGHYS